MELQAAETEGRTVNISSPRVVTANNLEAKIERGTKIPYSTSSAQGTNTQFIDATLSLTAKPQIAPNGTVILELTVTNNTPGSGSPPSIQKAELKTKVTVENGGTVVLGGVVTEDVANTESRVPLLSDIPFIGNLFKSTQKITSKGELLVFITPRVLDNTNSISAQ
jgi:type IV pilus assembly protein PilQ